MNDEQRKKIAGYIGIAQRAGKIAAGDTASREALNKRKASLLIIATDAAPTVNAELTALAGDNVPIISWPDKIDLGLIVGKSRRGALAVLDDGFAGAILKTLRNS